jgi:hypothetical protein
VLQLCNYSNYSILFIVAVSLAAKLLRKINWMDIIISVIRVKRYCIERCRFLIYTNNVIRSYAFRNLYLMNSFSPWNAVYQLFLLNLLNYKSIRLALTTITMINNFIVRYFFFFFNINALRS